ncbi:hypothetical protein GCM10022199_03590 [Marihabitans asiaticum]|uniref:YacP-like NYN domain-containing protein n=1 Tax=Marihabitans asiaticum TaxID=415218 RepID=A0A560WE75_9MICO|nr:hypothetical protein [Marihabitans asiaticum]TWD15967.1 hypothetical protein FB557_1507 [Marihabitans asiaticum]
MSAARVLVVDAANVIGSVPDGWWRDRAGAAARLHAHLVGAVDGGALPYDEVVLVLEGQGRRGVTAGSVDAGSDHDAGSDDAGADQGVVVTVHAAGEGDDEVVSQCRRAVKAGDVVSVATADRGLLARLDGLGVVVVGPRSVRMSPSSSVSAARRP